MTEDEAIQYQPNPLSCSCGTQMPGTIDKHVFWQDVWWMDSKGQWILLDALESDHRLNLLHFLAANGERWWSSQDELVAGYGNYVMAAPTTEWLRIRSGAAHRSEIGAQGWITRCPLVNAIRDLEGLGSTSWGPWGDADYAFVVNLQDVI